MLDFLGDSARFVHIAFGAVGLVAFWVPVFARKGANLHVKAGKVFVWCAYVVLAAAAAALLSRVTGLLLAGQYPSDQPGLYSFIVFLSYLTLVTFATVRHGMALLRHKREPGALRTPIHLVIAWSAIGASVGVIAYALFMDSPVQVLLLALSPIGFLTGRGMLRYMSAPDASPREWWYEHMGAMLGAGIAFHTAFAVFGATRLFDIGLTGYIAVIPWVTPAIIGVPAIAIWTRYYRRKFGEPA
jgi:hypothetical protein